MIAFWPLSKIEFIQKEIEPGQFEVMIGSSSTDFI